MDVEKLPITCGEPTSEDLSTSIFFAAPRAPETTVHPPTWFHDPGRKPLLVSDAGDPKPAHHAPWGFGG